MRWNYRKKAGTFSAAEDGVVAVEMVILFPVFMLIIVGIIEFGYLFYVRHTLTNATREGARAAVVYFPSARESSATTAARNAIKKYLGIGGGKSTVLPGITLLPDIENGPIVQFSAGPADPVSGKIPPAGTTGSLVTVKITASDVLLILDKFINSSSLSVSGETTMRME
jgi:Flp pilus assembly protein TadG